MNDPSKTTKSPPLLLMGSLERVPLDQGGVGSLHMPIPRQSQESPSFSSDAGEEDSFVGQSTATSSVQFFSSLPEGGPDPFANVKQPLSGAPTHSVGPLGSIMTASTPSAPIINASPHIQPLIKGTSLQSVPRPPYGAPPKASATPGISHYQKPSATRYQYVQAPVGPVSSAAAAPPPVGFQTSNVNMPPPPSGFVQMPFGSPGSFEAQPSTSLTAPPFQPQANRQRLQFHWCYQTAVQPREVWLPFSHKDSSLLEETFLTGEASQPRVCVNGGRYDVCVDGRLRYPVYWEGEPSNVRRCSWFYKPEGDNHFVPYKEDFAAQLEVQYQNTLQTGNYHKRIDFPGGEVIVIHNPSVVVQYTSSSQPDEWGMTGTDQSRPRVVKRGPEEVLLDIPAGEADQIDHLVFVVHGIGSTCDLRFRNIVECVDDMRFTSFGLLESHFRKASPKVGRVEFLPVRWHAALHGDATGVDKQLNNITLGSINKLRHFTNDTLLDILFYSSPVYAQQIMDTVVSELNRIYHVFLTRNPVFGKGVSVVGHSLGSLILFDLLSHQKNRDASASISHLSLTVDDNVPAQPNSSSPPSETFEMVSQLSSSDDEEVLDIEYMLSKLSLSSLKDTFDREQVDLDTLVLLEETDLKEMGIPLGPRKKIQTFIKEQKAKKEGQQERDAQKKLQQMLQERLQAAEADKPAQPTGEGVVGDPVLRQASETQVNYLIGVGSKGIGVPFRKFSSLNFSPENFFAIGSPVAMFLTVRGVDTLGEDFHFETCPGFFNIFHPFDPVAYRMEPLLVPSCPPRPVLMPHHKGRKRMHLELKESLSRMGADLKQRFMESVRSTWKSISQFAAAHRVAGQESSVEQVEAVATEVLAAADDTESVMSALEEDDLLVSSLNQGRRIDHVLQEGPLESFNEYLFALGSHACYWDSEDTLLLILKEIYAPLGIEPQFPGKNTGKQFPPPPPAVSAPYPAMNKPPLHTVPMAPSFPPPPAGQI